MIFEVSVCGCLCHSVGKKETSESACCPETKEPQWGVRAGAAVSDGSRFQICWPQMRKVEEVR